MQQELLSTTRQPYKYNDWRAALRTMGAVADASGNEEVLNSDQAQSHFLSKKGNDVVTFSSFIDAFRFAPQATFGTLLATCTKAFENEELPGTLLRSNTNSSTVSFITHVTNTSEVKAQVSQLKVYEQYLQSTIQAPPLLTDDFTQRFLGSSRNNGTNGAAVDKDIHFTSGGENIVWILAGHINGEAVRYAEEAMHSRMRLYPKSRIILVDNGSPSNEAEKLRELVKKTIPGENHSYVHNPPPSTFEQGAFHSGLKELISTAPSPSENELVVFTQATTVLLRPLPLEDIFQPGCGIRPIYQPCCQAIPTPPCNETEQKDWVPRVCHEALRQTVCVPLLSSYLADLNLSTLAHVYPYPSSLILSATNNLKKFALMVVNVQ